MSYILDKFEAGEVHIENNVCGWRFEECDLRPLMQDAMIELLEAGHVTNKHVAATMVARTAHEKVFLEEYFENQKEFWSNPDNEEAQREQEAEMRAAFGPGETVVNVFTGKEHKL